MAGLNKTSLTSSLRILLQPTGKQTSSTSGKQIKLFTSRGHELPYPTTYRRFVTLVPAATRFDVSSHKSVLHRHIHQQGPHHQQVAEKQLTNALVNVYPQTGMLDEKSQISVSGLDAGQDVTLWMTFVDDSGIEFSSHSHYRADQVGNIDVTRNSSLGGKYVGVFPQGPLATLHAAPPAYAKKQHLKWARLLKKDVTKPMQYKLSIVRGHLSEGELYSGQNLDILGAEEISRVLMAPGVTRHEVEGDSIRGTLFLPEGPGPYPAVLDLFGSHGGCMEFRSALLASKGFASLTLPYFAYKDLPRKLDGLKVEYFLEALDYLKALPGSMDRLGIIGASKGGEIALVLAGIHPNVKAALSVNCYNVSVGVPFVYNGKKYVPASKRDQTNSYVHITKEGRMSVWGFDDMYEWHNKESIPIEKIPKDVSVLLAAGDDDGAMAHRSAMALWQRAREHKLNNVRMMVLPGAGHIIDPPYHSHVDAVWNNHNMMNDKKTGKKLPGVAQVYGGDPYMTSKASEDLWKRTIDFFRDSLITNEESSESLK